MKKQKVIYKITHTFKTDKENPTEEELKKIFNKKLFKVIMKLEKNGFNINDKQDKLLENKKINKLLIWKYE